jgi:predicted transcriptional regulator
MGSSEPGPSWTFLTNHARILIMIARDPGIRLRDVAAACGITERTAQAIVADLETGGYLTHTREGRRNRYLVTVGTRFRHVAEADHEIAGLLALINEGAAYSEPYPGRNGEAAASDGGAGRRGAPESARSGGD